MGALKKFSRPLAFFLSFIISFSIFLVPSGAATNLINPDLTQWSAPIPEAGFTVLSYGDIYRLTADFQGYTGTDDNVSLYLGQIVDSAFLKAGNSYTFTCHIPSGAEIRALTTYTNTDAWFQSAYADAGLGIGFGFLNDDGTVDVVVDFISLTYDNWLSYAGKDFTHSFTCPDYSGSNPCIVIMGASTYKQSVFFLGTMSLIDNAEEEEEGFLSKIFEWFQERFDDLSGWFSNLGDRISDFFENLGQKLEDGLNGLLEGIGGWFQKLGNLILYLTWSEEVPENPFEAEDGPLDKVEGFFDELIDYLRNLKTDLLNLIDSVTAGIHIFDLFTDRFTWVKSLCLFAFALIIFSRFVGL